MLWLTARGVAVAPVEWANTLAARIRGLLGRSEIDGVLVLERARSVHTVGMKFPIDVAYCKPDGSILKVVTMPTNRIGLPRPRCGLVIETEAGNFGRWNLGSGDKVSFEDMADHQAPGQSTRRPPG